MKNEREGRGARDPFDMFGGVGNFGGFGGSIFGRNPFDDPFFTTPFSSMFDQRNLMRDSFPVIPPNGPTIRELTSDDDDDDNDDGRNEEENKEGKGQKGAIHQNQPIIDHPDDETDGLAGDSEHVNSRTDYNRPQGTQPQTVKVHSCKVTYGGIDGVYYSSSATRRMGSDGVIMEECKEADKTKGEATHRISRGLHDKGHSLTRKLNPDGKVDTMQTLHNLNEDELGSFEEAWKGNTGMHLPPSTGSRSGQADKMSDWGGSLVPSIRHMRDPWGREPHNESRTDPSSGRTKKVVRIPIE